jgi:hypothetical protein
VAKFGFGKSDFIFEPVALYVLTLRKKKLLIFLGWNDELKFSSQKNVMRQTSGLLY